MSTRRTLILAAVAFAILWTAGMCWWNFPLPRASAAILVAIAAVQAFVWFWVMRAWMTWAGLLTPPARS